MKYGLVIRVLPFTLALTAHAAVAGCFTADALPGRVTYESGAVLDYLGFEAGVLTYRTGSLTSRLINGLLPLDHKGEGFAMEYRWEGEPPTLSTVAVAGGSLMIRGKRQTNGKAPVAVRLELALLGEEVIDWEDCRYTLTRFRRTMMVEGKKESESVILFAPGPMIAFRTEAMEFSTGKPFVYSIKTME